MKDLTQGTISRHMLQMSAPIMVGMLVQTMYLMVDLYFIGKLGGDALAGVGAAGNIMFIIMALTQMIGSGTAALVARAVGAGRKDECNLIVGQSLGIAMVCIVCTLGAGYGLADWYMTLLGSAPATHAAGLSYLRWFTPGLALQFAMIVMGSSLRGTGVVKPSMMVQLVTVVINLALAPILIGGWGTGYPMNVAGAGLASTISVACGVLLMSRFFFRPGRYVEIALSNIRPRWDTWKRILNIGFPAGAEFGFTFLSASIVYAAVSTFGASAMAGYGVGSRIMQAIFMPAMSIAFAVPAIVGQNLGAGRMDRVREAMRTAFLLEMLVMFLAMVLCKAAPSWLVAPFSSDAHAASVAVGFLVFVSWNFVATGIISVCSSMFQSLGNSWPIMISTSIRVLTFALPLVWMTRRPGFAIEHIWYLSVATVFLQMLVSLLLLNREWRKAAVQGQPAPAMEAATSN